MKKIVLFIVVCIFTAQLTGLCSMQSPIIIVDSAADFVTAVNSAVAGNVIVLKNGTYFEFDIALNATGSVGNPIVIRAEQPGGVIFTGESHVKLESCKYVVFSGFRFEQTGPRDGVPKKKAVLLLNRSSDNVISNNYFYKCGYNSVSGNIEVVNGARRNRITNNTFDGHRSAGIRIIVDSVSNPDNVNNRIDHNYFVDVPFVGDVYSGATNGNESIQIGATEFIKYYNINTVVEYNLFERVTGDRGEMISNKASSNIYRYNTFKDCDSGLTLRHGKSSIVEGNFFSNCLWGVRVFNDNHIIANNYFNAIQKTAIDLPNTNSTDLALVSPGHFQQNNTLIVNNTIIEAVEYGIALGVTNDGRTGYTKPPNDTKIKNNLIVYKNGIGIKNNGSTAISYTKNKGLKTGSGIPGTTNLTTAVGLAMTFSEGMYRPNSVVDIVNGGTSNTIYPITNDIDGQPRENGIDVGADEVNSSYPITRRPLTQADVGFKSATESDIRVEFVNFITDTETPVDITQTGLVSGIIKASFKITNLTGMPYSASAAFVLSNKSGSQPGVLHNLVIDSNPDTIPAFSSAYYTETIDVPLESLADARISILLFNSLTGLKPQIKSIDFDNSGMK